MLASIMIGILLSLMMLLPLAWKWQLGVIRIALLVLLLALPAGFLVVAIGRLILINPELEAILLWLIIIIEVFIFIAYHFYRDPERAVPDQGDAIVSPADGKVIYIRQSQNGKLPTAIKHHHEYSLHELIKTPFYCQDAVVVGISMNFLDVHVNRAPIAGYISFYQHFPGYFGSLRQPEMVFENERATTIIKQGNLQVAVVQIASRLVRQIAAFVREGQDVMLGQRIGVIRFGSQVDLVLPVSPQLKLMVYQGDRVKAGQSIIALYTGGKREP